jgi:O-antigen/teichoic acid export membrane protein
LTKAVAPVVETPGARLLSNSRWNLLAFGASLVVNFVTLPLVITAIGLEAFGVGGLVIAIYAPFVLVGTVLGQAMIRELAPLLEAGDTRRAASTLSAGVVLCALACGLVVLGLVLVGALAVPLFGPQPATQLDWGKAFLIAGAGWAAQQGVLFAQAVLAARQRYAPLALLTGLTAIASAVVLVTACRAWPGTLGFLAGTSAGFVLSLGLWSMLMRRLLPDVSPFAGFGREELRAIAHFGKWQGAAHFAGAVGNQIDRYVLGAMAPAAVVGFFNVAMRLQEVVHMGLLKATEVLLPHFSVTQQDPTDKRARFFLQCSWVMNVLGVAALAPLIPLASGLITLWIDAPTAGGAAPMLRTLAAAGVLGCGVNVYYYFAVGTGQTARIALITTSHAVLTVALTVLMILTFGPLAAGTGYLLANLMRLVATLWFVNRHFESSAPLSQLSSCNLPPLFAGLAFAIVAWQAGWPDARSWAGWLFSYMALGAAVAAVAVSATAATRPGRVIAAQTLRALGAMLPGRA